MKKPCNPKSEKATDPAYECNPETGRWVLRKSRKKVPSPKRLTPSPARSLLTPIPVIPKIPSRKKRLSPKRKNREKYQGLRRESRRVCQNDEDPVTGEYVEEIEDLIKIKTDTGDWVCFNRTALIDNVANGPIWFANKTMSDNIQEFIEFFITFRPNAHGYEELRNKVIYDLYNDGEADHIGFFLSHMKTHRNADLVEIFLNKLFTTYRLLEWPLDDKILLSGTSLKYLKDPSIVEFHMVESTYVAEEPHTFFGKGPKSYIYLIAPMNVNKIEPLAISTRTKPHPIVVADHDDLDAIFEEIDELPEAEYGRKNYNIGDIAEEHGIV